MCTANDGNTALISCKEEQPNLILLDIKLPDMHGIDVVNIISKQKAKYGFPKIIIITGYGYSIDNVKKNFQREFKVAGFLTKPIDYELFLRKIEETLKME